MRFWKRVLLFIAPFVLAAVAKATMATAEAGELAISHPAKTIDLSIDLLPTASSVLIHPGGGRRGVCLESDDRVGGSSLGCSPSDFGIQLLPPPAPW